MFAQCSRIWHIPLEQIYHLSFLLGRLHHLRVHACIQENIACSYFGICTEKLVGPSKPELKFNADENETSFWKLFIFYMLPLNSQMDLSLCPRNSAFSFSCFSFFPVFKKLFLSLCCWSVFFPKCLKKSKSDVCGSADVQCLCCYGSKS